MFLSIAKAWWFKLLVGFVAILQIDFKKKFFLKLNWGRSPMGQTLWHCFCLCLSEDEWLCAALDCLDFLPDQLVVELNRELPHCFPQCREGFNQEAAGDCIRNSSKCVSISIACIQTIFVNVRFLFLLLQFTAVLSRVLFPRADWLSLSWYSMGYWSNTTEI